MIGLMPAVIIISYTSIFWAYDLSVIGGWPSWLQWTGVTDEVAELSYC